MRHCHFFIVEIIAESVNLMQMLKQNRNYYHHDEKQLGFYKKSAYQNTKYDQKEGCSCNFTLQETNEF